MEEHDLRKALADKAESFSMSERPPKRILRDAKKRFVVSVVRGATVLSLLLGTGVFFVAGNDSDRPSHRVSAKAPVLIQLVDDYVEDEGEGRDDAVSRDEVDAHVACMREQGFDLPDAVRTSDGWAIEVDDPEAMGIDGPAWREASFVTCRPTPAPGGDDLIFGVPMSEDEIHAFESCMEQEGFPLPEATPLDGPGWKFDLSDSEVAFDDDGWNRAVFVTCWPGDREDGP